MEFLKRWHPQIYALARIVIGFFFLCHGIQKILMGGPPPGVPMPAAIFWLAAAIETVGGTLVMVGLFASFAAFICSGMMAFAYFMAHFPWALTPVENLLPINNHGEPAAVYSFVFLLFASLGSGIWSVDAARGARS